MVQTIRPISDISAGSWTDEGGTDNDGNLYTSLDETSQDGDSSRVEGASGAGTFEVKLATATDPVSAVDHTVYLWGKGVGSGAGEKVDVFLYESTTLIATIANNWTPGRSAYAELSYTLSAGEANSISDYSDLRVRVVEDTIGGGSERFNVTQIYMEVPDAAAIITQSNFRIRDNDDELINSSTFSHARNANATIDAESLFRIRYEIGSDGDDTDTYKIQENYDSEGWVDCEAPGINPPAGVGVVRTSFAPSAQYADGVATTDVMSGEAGAFVAGSGEESNNTASVILAAGEHTEFEFCLIIRKLYGDDGTAWGYTTDGDTVQYRVVKSDGTVLAYTNTPTITINHPIGLIGGTFPETPGQILVAEDTGILYCVVEHAQLPTPIIPSMLKSEDGGDSWVPQDDADWASSTIELEAADLHYIPTDDKIYMGMTSSTDPDYREFQTSGHGTPDAFTAASVEVTAVGSVTEQVQAIVRRSDNTVVMFYNELSTDGKLRYKIRTSGGSWGSQLTCEGEVGTNWSSCQIVIGASDLIHIIYSGDAAGDPIYYRNLNSSDTLSGRTSLTTDTDAANFSPFLKPVYWNDGGTEKVYLIYFKTTDNKLYSRIVTSGSVGSESVSAITDNAVLTDRASSGRPTAAAVVDGDDVYVVYSHETDLDIYMTKSINGGSFDTDTEILDAVTCGLMSAELFTHNAGNGSAKVIGIIYDDERFGEGNTGGPVYWEYEIPSVITISVSAFALTGAFDTTTVLNPKVVSVNAFASAIVMGNVTVDVGAAITITVTTFGLTGAFSNVTILNPKVIGISVFTIVGNFDSTIVLNPKTISATVFGLVGTFDSVTILNPKFVGVSAFAIVGNFGTVIITNPKIVATTTFALIGAMGNVNVIRPRIISITTLALVVNIGSVNVTLSKIVSINTFSLVGLFDSAVVLNPKTISANTLALTAAFDTVTISSSKIISVNQFTLASAMGNVNVTNPKTVQVNPFALSGVFDSVIVINTSVIIIPVITFAITTDFDNVITTNSKIIEVNTFTIGCVIGIMGGPPIVVSPTPSPDVVVTVGGGMFDKEQLRAETTEFELPDIELPISPIARITQRIRENELLEIFFISDDDI